MAHDLREIGRARAVSRVGAKRLSAVKRLVALLLLVLATAAYGQAPRADDFEERQGRAQIARTDAFSRISGHLNLGDIFAARNDRAAAQRQWRIAEETAEKERRSARAASDLSRYARSTSYSGLAAAKLGKREEAHRLFEESLRYTADSPSAWNFYASAMSLLGDSGKAASGARNAIALTERRPDLASNTAAHLDLNVYRYALAAALTAAGNEKEAAPLLEGIIESLLSSRFDRIRAQIRDGEKFEILSTTSADADAYLTLLARSRIRLAEIHERRGEAAQAAVLYRQVLDQRSDEPHALAALARLGAGRSDGERFADAFEASPFSWKLITDYRRQLKETAVASQGDSRGARMRQLLERMSASRWESAAELAVELREENPENDSLLALSAEIATRLGRREEAERFQRAIRNGAISRDLAALIQSVPNDPLGRIRSIASRPRLESAEVSELHVLLVGDLSPELRELLDSAVFRSGVALGEAVADEETTTIAMARAGRTTLRFSESTRFRGRFSSGEEVTLAFRILGASEDESGPFLLVEPSGLSR
jgi:tetratricopeptide (TPR) repeat protein